MIEIRLPLKAESTANLREHWATKARRTKAQRAAVARRLPPWPGGALLVVRLTRISPRMLDSGDNLSMSLKGFRDSVASRLKVDDASPLVDWQYHQAKGEAEVVVQIWRAEEDAPLFPVGRMIERGGRTKAERIAERLRGMGMRVEIVKPIKKRGRALAVASADAGKPLSVARESGTGQHRAHRPSYTPPRSKPVDAVKEAEETFASSPQPASPMCSCGSCAFCVAGMP
jgi:hypothetical protein